MLTPSFRLVGVFCAFAPVGVTFHLPGGAISICPGEGHFHFLVAPVGISSDSNRFFLFLTNFLLWVPFLGLVITPSPDRFFCWDWRSHRPRIAYWVSGPHLTFGLDWIVLIARI